MYSGGNDLMKEEKSPKEIQEVREELYITDKEKKEKLLFEIRKKYKNVFV